MSQDSHSQSEARYRTNWPAVIGVALLVPIAVAGPIMSLLLSPKSSESRKTVVQSPSVQVYHTTPLRLPFQGPAAPESLTAVDSAAVAENQAVVDEKPTSSVISTHTAIEIPGAPTRNNPIDDFTRPAPTTGEVAPPESEPDAVSIKTAVSVPDEPQDEFRSPSEYELIDELARLTKTIDLDSVADTTKSLLSAELDVDGDSHSRLAALKKVVDQRPDLEGLPFEDVDTCDLNRTAAETLNAISGEVRTIQGQRDLERSRSLSLSSATSEGTSFAYLMRSNRRWRTLAAIPGLVQTMQVQEPYDRAALIEVLAYVPHETTSVMLAQRALFDLSEAVRNNATTALARRPADEFRDQLLNGFRYPWPRVAEHSARALIKLGDQDVVPELVDLLDASNPNAPYRHENKWVVNELVRVNHMRNCVLCHAPSTSSRDLVRGFVPSPGQRLPRFYYQSRRTSGSFVRADTTYLRQDFSVMHYLEDQKPWPDVQRFDYFVRTRRATPNETRVFAARSESEHESPPYPQRKAVLFALRKLTGVDLGDKSDAWHKHF